MALINSINAAIQHKKQNPLSVTALLNFSLLLYDNTTDGGWTNGMLSKNDTMMLTGYLLKGPYIRIYDTSLS